MTRWIAAALVAAAGLGGCATEPPRVEVHGMRLRPTPNDYPELSGYVVNLSDQPIASADVSVTLYDADNQLLGDEMVQVLVTVAPGDSARFEQRLDRPAAAARLRHVTAS